jgi:hypothetical protein
LGFRVTLMRMAVGAMRKACGNTAYVRTSGEQGT